MTDSNAMKLVGLPFEHHDYHRHVLLGVVDFVRPYHNWALERIWPTVERVRGLAERGASGFIGMLTDPAVIGCVRELGIPAVNISGRCEVEGIANVISDDDMIGQLAANHLAARQYRHYGYVGQPEMLLAERRRHGFQFGLAELGVAAADYSELPLGRWPDEILTDARLSPLGRRLVELPKPAGIFCSNDQVAAHVHHVGIHCGLDLHRDVCLLGVDNQLDYCEAVHPPFSSVALGMIGFLAAETLQRLMSGQSAPAVTYVAPRGVISRGEGETEADLPSEVKTVMQLIASHMGQVSSIDDLLRNVPLSRRYMEKRFKQATGRSIYQEIQRQRIERASMLLATTRWPVERVGKAAGFSNPRQFSRVFRQFTQSTPRDYRQRRNRESRGAVDGGHDMA